MGCSLLRRCISNLPQHSVLIRFFEAPQSPQRGLSLESADRFLVDTAIFEAAFFFAISKTPSTIQADETSRVNPTIRNFEARILAHSELGTM